MRKFLNIAVFKKKKKTLEHLGSELIIIFGETEMIM